MSGFSNIAVHNYGFFKESRCFFEGFNADNDIHPDTKKTGIRCHNWFTALFLRILGKIDTVTTIDGKKFYLNKKSCLKWRQRQAEKMRSPSDNAERQGPLPTAAEILDTRKKVIKCQAAIRSFLAKKKLQKLKEGKKLRLQQERKLKEQKLKEQKQLYDAALACQRRIHARNTRKKYQELVTLHRQVKEIESETKEIVKIQKNIDAFIETKNATSEKIKELNQELAPLVEKDNTLKLEAEVLKQEILQIDVETKKLKGPELKNRLSFWTKKQEATASLKARKKEIKVNLEELHRRQEPIKTFENIIEGIDTEIKKFEAEKKEQEELLKKLKETKDKVNILRDQILDRSAVIQLASVKNAAPIEEPTVTQEPAAPVTPPHILMLEQIKKSAGPELSALIDGLFSKFDSGTVKGWKFNEQTRGFKITLGQEVKIWTDSQDKETPKGFVLILQNTISGTLEDKKIIFNSGLKGYCHYRKLGTSGTADSTFKNISYDQVRREFHFLSLGTPREPIVFLGRPTREVSKERSYESALGSWSNGEIVPTDTTAEKFLANKVAS